MNKDQLLVFNEKFKNIKYLKIILLNAIKIYNYDYPNINIINLLYKNNFNCIISKKINENLYEKYKTIYDFTYFKIIYTNLDDFNMLNIYKIYLKINNKLFSYEISINNNANSELFYNIVCKMDIYKFINKFISIKNDYIFNSIILNDNDILDTTIKKNFMNNQLSIYKNYNKEFTYIFKKYKYKEYINNLLYCFVKLIDNFSISFNVHEQFKNDVELKNRVYFSIINKYYHNNYIYYHLCDSYDDVNINNNNININKYLLKKYLINKYKILYII